MRLVVSSYCRTPRMLPCSTPRYKKICRFLYAHFIELCVWWSRRTVVLLACCHAPPRDIRKYAVFCLPFLLSYWIGGVLVLPPSSHVAIPLPAQSAINLCLSPCVIERGSGWARGH